MKKIALSFLLVGAGLLGAQAQYAQEILRFSQPEFGSTARFKALANAQTALGGDLSSIAGNPAGLGFFNQSDFGFSLDYFSDKNKATFFGAQSANTVNRLGINQVGVVFNLPSSRQRGSNLESGWLNFNIGVAYNRTNNFNTTLGFKGLNPESSFADFMTYEDGQDAGNFGWESGMIDENALGELFAVTRLNNMQTLTQKERGFQSETNISFGANYSNRLYIGGGVGLTHINNAMDYLFMEDGHIADHGFIHPQNTNSRFVDPANEDYDTYNPLLESSYEFDRSYESKSRGSGVNLKLGVIYKPIHQLQLGFSATSPTWSRITNDYKDYYGITNFLAGGGDSSYEYPEEPSLFEYNLSSPYRLNGGAAVILGRGLISADVEYLDYASMRFSSTDNATDRRMADNIGDLYKSAVNFRIGGEYLLHQGFLLRAGYATTGSPYQQINSTTQTISGGVGYRVNNMYLDLTYQNFGESYSFNTYLLDDANNHPSPVVDVNHNQNRVFVTLGFKF